MQDKKFILNYYPPAGFPKRGKNDTGTCAIYTLKAVIEAKTGENRILKDYTDGWRSYISNFMSPRSLLSVLRKYGVGYKVLRYRFIDKSERIKLLKKEILEGPIILAIGNGLTKKEYFSRKKALMHRHYISLRGFNDEEECFYVYDSSCVRDVDPLLEIGTIKIPYKYILKCRNLGFYKIFSNFGIAIKY